MTRILILGAAPLPFEPQMRQYAANLRTWHFTRPLLDDGHQVRLIGCRLPNAYGEDVDPVSFTERKRLEYYSISGELFHDRAFVQQLADDFDPQAILGVNTHPSSRAVLIDTDRPIWCDLNGWIMAEAQTKCYVYDDDRYLSHFWNMERDILDRADVISAVSDAQARATVGELAVRGRLGRKNFGHDFVHRIPNAISEVEYEHHRTVIRDGVVAEDAFVVLWAGGYNTWTDVGLLYDALTTAMKQVPELTFVSTGGAIEGHDEITFESFRKRAKESAFADRFHFAGWVPTEDVPCYYFESNLGINVDSFNYETVFGARNRLNDWMKVGLPVLTTSGTEISEIIEEHDLGLTCSTGDAEGFAERLIWAARHRDELRSMAECAREYAHREFSYERTTRPMRAWAEAPYRAPDLGQRVEFEDIDFFSQPESTPEHAHAEALPEPGEIPEIQRNAVHAVIVHHRGRDILRVAVSSLLASSHVELEIVVVENGCDEELPRVVHDSGRVHVVRAPAPLGFSAANNLGVAWAREHLGEPHFYYFVNNDTESTPDALARQIAAIEARPVAAMAGPTLLILGADDHYNSLGINVTEDGWGWDEAIGQRIADYGPPPPSRGVLTVTGSALLIDAPVFHVIGGWTEVYEYYFEDIDLGIKVWKAHREVIHVPEAVVRHQISATMGDGSERKDFLFWRNRLVLALVHWPFGLLLATFRRAVGELFDRRRTDRPVLRRAMLQALGRLPSLLRCRWRWRGPAVWRQFLVLPGSVPVITLPEIETGGATEVEPAAAEPNDEAAAAPATEDLDIATMDVAALADQPGLRSVAGYLNRELVETRAELAAATDRADRLGGSYVEAMRVLDQIHSSRMWRLWKRYMAMRQWLRPSRRG
ncbi:MAG: glycosyltransferase [bacterium]|nr:glycosyltransferase [bacterium]